MEHSNKNILLLFHEIYFRESTLDWAKMLASLFDAGLIFAIISDKNKINSKHLSDPFPTYYFNKNEIENIYSFAEEYHIILHVVCCDKEMAAINRPKYLIKLIRKSRIPFLVVQSESPTTKAFDHIVVSLDYYQQSKDLALWGSYFNTFHRSKIHIMPLAYRDEYLKNYVRNNLRFVKKLYENLETDYCITSFSPTARNADKEALTYLEKTGKGIYVIMTTLDYNIDHWFFGLPEEKTIINKEKIPVLCVNQRDDLYVLCS